MRISKKSYNTESAPNSAPTDVWFNKILEKNSEVSNILQGQQTSVEKRESFRDRKNTSFDLKFVADSEYVVIIEDVMDKKFSEQSIRD
jgi:hypothetical protein